MRDDNTPPEYMELLVPEVLARLSRLEILARGPVSGFISGRHTSPFKGLSAEFAEHRQYAPGDDVSNLDWRVYGKSDRYYIKEYVEETNLRATLVVDVSASMDYVGSRAARIKGGRLSKYEYARYLAATLTYMLLHQQDAVGLVTFDTEVRSYIPARARTSHMRAILQQLQDTEPGGETAPAPILHDVAERIHRRSMVIVISDMFGDAEELVRALHHFRYRKHEVVVLHVMAEEERTFPFEGQMEFRDLEAAFEHMQLDARSIRAEYLDELRAFVDTLQEGCGRMRADYVPMSTAEPFDEALARCLVNRRMPVR